MKITSLGYVKVESPASRSWAQFGPEPLGMATSPGPVDDPDSVTLTVDDRPSRLVVSPGPRDRLAAVGWEVANKFQFHQAIDDLSVAGIDVERCSEQHCAGSQVRDAFTFLDPAGLRHEIFWGQRVVPGSFLPGRPMSGFVTGTQGLGHVVLIVPDLAESTKFFETTMGFAPSDEIDLDGLRVCFFHTNSRHHSLPLAEMPGFRGLHHIMVQTRALDDVGVAYDLCRRDGIPLSKTLGRHTNDHMVSFYLRTPSGFDLEYGWGATTIDDPESWAVTYMDTGSIWGHHPGDAPPPGCIEPAT